MPEQAAELNKCVVRDTAAAIWRAVAAFCDRRMLLKRDRAPALRERRYSAVER
jgi:hypothetical protein